MEYRQPEVMFLTKYFAVKSILGKKQSEDARIFDALAEVYRITDEKKEAFRKIVSSEEIESICTYDEYALTMRAVAYKEMCGEPMEIPEDLSFVLSCKGEALKKLSTVLSLCGSERIETKVKSVLSRADVSMYVPVASLAAFLYFEGIFFKKNEKRGLYYAERCMRWNDPDGILLLLRYGPEENKKEYLSVFDTVIKSTENADEFGDIISFYRGGEEITVSEEAEALAEYLNREPQNRYVYDETIAQIAHTPFFRIGDKKRILKNAPKEFFAGISGLAIKENPPVFSLGKRLGNFVSPERKSEANKLEICLRKQNSGSVKVPLIVCKDSFSAKIYYDAVKSMAAGEDKVTLIDGRTADRGAFAPLRTNVIIKSLVSANSASGIFVIDGADEISPEGAEMLSVMLNKFTGADYVLGDVGMGVNLSGCVFLLCASSVNVDDKIKNVCQVIEIGETTKEERMAYIKDIISGRQKAYECEALAFGEEALGFLADRDADSVCFTVETICREHSMESDRKEITLQDVTEALYGKSYRQMTFVIKNGR